MLAFRYACRGGDNEECRSFCAHRKRFGHSILDGLLITLFKTLMATILMWLAGQGLLYLCRNLPNGTGYGVLRLAVIVPTTAAVYTLIAKLLRIEMLSLFSGKKT